MTNTPPGGRRDAARLSPPGVSFVPDEAMVRLVRERDNLFLLHEALAEVDRAPTLQARLAVFVGAIQRIGFGRVVMTVRDAELNPVEIVTAGMTPDEDHMLRTGAASGSVWRTRLARMEPFRISQSFYLDSADPWVASEFGDALPSRVEPVPARRANWSPHDFLFVPLRNGAGRIIATLVLDDPADRTKPTLARVRTVELFAQQVASMLERMELYAESQRERSRGEALADVARAVSSSLRLENVLDLSLRHAVALLRVSGATLSVVRGDHLVIVAAIGAAERMMGETFPLDSSLSGRALRERGFIISNDSRRDPEAYAPYVQAARVERAIMAPLYSSEGPLGVLTVLNRAAPFDEGDATVLQRLADHVAIAVANARLFEEYRTLADRYRGVVETTADAIVITNRERRIVFTNAAAERLLGGGREVNGRLVSEFVPPEELAQIGEREDLALAGQPQRYESVLVRPDGERRLLSISNSPMRSGDEIVGVVASLRDVTEERRARDAVAQSEARYARLVQSASDGIFTMDPRGNLTSVNRSLERSVGRLRDELLGTPFVALLDPRDQLLGSQLFYEAHAGQSKRAELRYVAADGGTRFCSVMTTPIEDDGVLAGVLGIVRDVTEEKRLMEQLVQQEKLAAVGQLVSGVAHELNNPLAGVMAFSQLLLASPGVTPEQRPALETIDQEAKRAARIVAKLLTFARQHQPERAATDLNQVLLDTLELRRYALRVSQIEVVLKLDPTLPMTWADAFQLQQVALNLLANAEQAMEGWHGDRRIVLGTRNSGGTLILSVSDTGPGIAPDDLPRIFNPFFTTKAVGQGTGLGLSISDGIVREHGGRIRVESRIGQGATFCVELPHVSAPAMPPVGVPVSSDVAGEGRRVLLVDDEPSIRSAIATFLRSLGHTVDTFSSGRDVLDRIATHDYDVLVLDLRMPEMSGDTLYAELENRAPRLARRVVFLTGDIQSEATRGFLESTGRPIVTKPFMLDELAAVVLAEAAS